jgi:transcriptional regulator with GAF, ATPase, and Fis domain
MQSSWQSLLEQAQKSLDRWDVAACRELAARARALAASWGAAEGAALADVALARAALLVCARPDSHLLGPVEPRTGPVEAAVLRFRAELHAARRAGEAPATPRLAADVPDDALVAATILACERFADVNRLAPRIAGAAGVLGRDLGGWQLLLAALDAESAGSSGHRLAEAALTAARARTDHALEWTALRFRAALSRRRGASEQAAESERQMRALLQSWALTLPETDAAAALARPDRAALSETPSVATDDARRLVDVALALAHERDVSRLTQVALEAAVETTQAERGLLLLADLNAGFRIAAAHHADQQADRDLLGLSSSIARRALASREVIASDDVRSDVRLSDCASIALEVTSVLCVPILAHAEVQGALYLDRRRRGRAFDRAAIDAARAIGSMLAAALLNARTIETLEQQAKQLVIAQDKLSELLASRTVERDDAKRQLADVHGVVPVGGAELGLVGRGPSMDRLRKTIERIAFSDAPVLVVGETGSGKELVARALHGASGRRDKPFVAINCGAMSETLLEAELFGAERGAYTNATSSRPGLFVAAHGGSLFLDEVGDMPPAMQVALLRALETSEIRPVGSTRTRQVDVRVIAATHSDLHELEAAGTFRTDLRYRLEVLHVRVPPLREHLEDLPELCEHLLDAVRRQYGLPERRLSPDALEALARRTWRGNVRELRHVLANAALSAKGPAITAAELPEERSGQAPTSFRPSTPAQGAAATSFAEPADLSEDGHQIRVEAMRSALRATAGHRGRAAKLLGISRSTFYRYLELYGIDPREFDATNLRGAS